MKSIQIRVHPDFQKLIEKYKQKFQEEFGIELDTQQVTLRFAKKFQEEWLPDGEK